MSVRFGIRTLIAATALVALLIAARTSIHQQFVRWGLMANYRTPLNRAYESDGQTLYEIPIDSLPDNLAVAFAESGEVCLLTFDAGNRERSTSKRSLGFYRRIVLVDLTGTGELELLATNAMFPSDLGNVFTPELVWSYADGTISREAIAIGKADLDSSGGEGGGVALRLGKSVNQLDPFWVESSNAQFFWADLFGNGHPFYCVVTTHPEGVQFRKTLWHYTAYRPDGERVNEFKTHGWNSTSPEVSESELKGLLKDSSSFERQRYGF